MYIKRKLKNTYSNSNIREFLRMQKLGKHELPQGGRATGAMKLGTAAAGKATEYGGHLAYTGGDWEKA